jgi:hypothetical protein
MGDHFPITQFLDILVLVAGPGVTFEAVAGTTAAA